MRELLAPLRHRGAVGRRARPRRAGRDRHDLRRQCAHQGDGRRARRPACPPSPTIPVLVVEALGGEPGIYSARWAGPDKDFRGAMELHPDAADRARRTSAGTAPRAFHRRAVPRLAGRPRRGLRRPRRRHAGLAAARRCRLRLRPDVPARRLRPHLRRDERGGKARPAAARAKACRIAPAPSCNSRRLLA